MTLPLDDITIIEVDNWMAAPSAGAILADLGATVIKVEPIEGDPMRNKMRRLKIPEEQQGFDFQFDVDNRGKQSIAVDLNIEGGPALVHRLCQEADVFMCNLLIERQQRFGLDPESLLKTNPKIVHATFTGYGTTGPEAHRPGYDMTAFFARSGLYYMSRVGPDGDVPMARPAQGDHTAGLALVGSILAGIRLAERTGEGQVVESSLYETAVWTQASDYGLTAVDGKAMRPRSREQEINATANRYPCGDGNWIVVAMPIPAAWPNFARTVGLESLLDDERFAEFRNRFHNMAELVPLIDEAFAAKSRDEWGQVFDDAGIIWAPVLGLDEVVADPQAEALGLFPTIENEEIGDYRTVANPLKFKTVDVNPRRSHPKLGEHTRDVLSAAGLSNDEIDQLTSKGVVGVRDV